MTAIDRPLAKTRVRATVVEAGAARDRSDQVATEEPMEIRITAGGATQTVAVTMRTPGADFELAAGFLFNEGVVAGREDVRGIAYCVDSDVDEEQRYNIITVTLAGGLPELAPLERHFLTTSACGVCGKANLEALQMRGCQPPAGAEGLEPAILSALPDKLRRAQGLFEATGGLHAAGLFTPEGELVAAREDVGRHNALDKLIGWAMLDGRVPLSDHVVMVSGRTSYEIVQKCLAAGVPVVCAVSAPSSLAVAVAQEFGITLVGFLRGDRFNVYSGAERITGIS